MRYLSLALQRAKLFISFEKLFTKHFIAEQKLILFPLFIFSDMSFSQLLLLMIFQNLVRKSIFGKK